MQTQIKVSAVWPRQMGHGDEREWRSEWRGAEAARLGGDQIVRPPSQAWMVFPDVACKWELAAEIASVRPISWERLGTQLFLPRALGINIGRLPNSLVLCMWEWCFALSAQQKTHTHSTGAFAQRKRINCDVENKNTRGAKIIRTERLEYKDIFIPLRVGAAWPLQLTASIFFCTSPSQRARFHFPSVP